MFFSCAENIEYLKKKLHNNFDVVDKFFVAAGQNFAILYIKSLVDIKLLTEGLLRPLQNITTPAKNLLDVQNNIVCLGDMQLAQDFKEVLNALLNGKVAVFLDNQKECLLVDIQTVKARAPAEPPTSAVIYGPRLGFTESIEDNISSALNRCLRYAFE